MLSLNSDVTLSLDMVISHIGSTDITTSLQSLNQVRGGAPPLPSASHDPRHLVSVRQVDELLKSEDRREVLVSHVDQLLVVCSLQLRMTHSKHMGDLSTDRDSVTALYKNILGLLLAVSKPGEGPAHL